MKEIFQFFKKQLENIKMKLRPQDYIKVQIPRKGTYTELLFNDFWISGPKNIFMETKILKVKDYKMDPPIRNYKVN